MALLRASKLPVLSVLRTSFAGSHASVRHSGSIIQDKGRSEENVRFRKEDEKLLRALLNKVKQQADAVDVHEAETSKSAELSALKEIVGKYKVSEEDLSALLAWKHS